MIDGVRATLSYSYPVSQLRLANQLPNIPAKTLLLMKRRPAFNPFEGRDGSDRYGLARNVGAMSGNVRYWHKADMLNALTNVRFWGQSGHGPTAAYQSRFMSTRPNKARGGRKKCSGLRLGPPGWRSLAKHELLELFLGTPWSIVSPLAVKI